MFTGLIEEMGRVAHVEERPAGRRYQFEAKAILDGMRVGDSIAVNGCCLTAVEVSDTSFAADVVAETLSRTTLGSWQAGDRVNLERSLRLNDRLGGHLVQGHVDGVGKVTDIKSEGDSMRVSIDFSEALAPYVAEKGSIAIDGTSLTVAACSRTTCEVALVPHTLAETISGTYESGRRVNIEVDLVARYLARFVETGAPFGGVT